MAIREVTYTLPGDDEVMVHFDSNAPRVPIRVYCYSDSWLVDPVQSANMDGLERGLSWSQSKRNPLFWDASDPVKALRQIKRHGYIR